MARRHADHEPDPTDIDAPPESIDEPEAEAVKPGPDDVLCYVDRMGAMVCHWNSLPEGAPVGGVVIPVGNRCRLEPGLSFCPGVQWPAVKVSPGWTERLKYGAIRAVAGHGGDLMAEWQRLKFVALGPMLAKTFHLPALERLREMEASLPRPRLDVAQEIDARLAEMGAKLGQHQAGRRAQRRVHRSKVLG
jgi:hypothetical protein